MTSPREPSSVAGALRPHNVLVLAAILVVAIAAVLLISGTGAQATHPPTVGTPTPPSNGTPTQPAGTPTPPVGTPTPPAGTPTPPAGTPTPPAGTPTPPVGGEGCTPGFWKNHQEVWDGVGGDDVTTTIQTTDGFNATFGVTPAQSGQPNSLTLLGAAQQGGGGLNALARHAAAALASADSGIDYQYSVAGVIALYRDAVGADAGPETVSSAHGKLEAANEEGCPF